MAFNYFRENPNLTLTDFDLCPFCGQEILVEREDGVRLETWDRQIGIWNIVCEECDISIGPFISPTSACLVWNRRSEKKKGSEEK